MPTKQTFNDEIHGHVGFTDLRENVHSDKARVRDIRIQGKPGLETARLKREICEDINKVRNTK
jgi:hypothetical protein